MNYKRKYEDGKPLSGLHRSTNPCKNCGQDIYWQYVDGYYVGGSRPRNQDGGLHECVKAERDNDMGLTREQIINALEQAGYTRSSIKTLNIKELAAMLAAVMSEGKGKGEGEEKKEEEPTPMPMPEEDPSPLHSQTHTLLTVVNAGMHVALVGPSGSMKTSTAHIVAQALGFNFESQSFCNQTSEAKLIGFVAAGGNIVETPFRNVFVNGGVFLSDEFDAANPNIGVVLNSASANGFCSFPDGTLYAHKDFRLILGMNTVGAGADRKYVGRNQLDAATRDRFAIINWNYDPKLELQIAHSIASGENFNELQKIAIREMVATIQAQAKKKVDVAKWTEWCHKTREKADELGISERNVVASPRAVFGGIRLLEAGLSSSVVADLLVFNKLGVDDGKKLLNACPVPTKVAE